MTLSPAEVEHWLRGLGSLLPREAVSALAEEVLRQSIDGSAFDALVASRAMPSLGDAVRPNHMATLRRCWNAKKPSKESAVRADGKAAESQARHDAPAAQSQFRPPPRHQPVEESRTPARQRTLPGQQSVEEPELSPAPSQQIDDSLPVVPIEIPDEKDLAEDAEREGEASKTPLSYAMQKRKAARPPQVPRLNLSLLNKGNSDSDNLMKHEWKPGKPHSRLGSSASAASDDPRRVGFANASAEDQQRIAEFYGYRDEGFISTMKNLRTDVIRPRLYVGNMADAAYWPLLTKLGITHVVNCAIEAQKVPPAYDSKGIQYLMMPWQDREEEAQSLTRARFRVLRGATKYIQAALKAKDANNAVLLHCVQGLSRSPTLACAYLMEFEGLSLDRAISEVQSKHKGCLTSQHWQTMLHKFNAELLKGT